MSTEITEALRRGDTAAALAQAQRLAQAEPENAEAQHLLGLALQRSGDAAGARAAFERAIALAPENPGYPFSLASLALSRGDLAAAEEFFRRAVALNPNQLPAYVVGVQIALARNDREAAEDQVKRALRVNPNHPLTMLAEGYLARFDKDDDRAIKLFTAATQANPDLAAGQIALGIALLERGLWSFAEQALANGRRLDPSNEGVLRALIDSQLRQNKGEDALANADALVQMRPADPVARLRRALLAQGMGRVDEPLADAEVLLDQRPGDPQLLGLYIDLMRRSGRAEAALGRLEAGVAANPADDRVWIQRLSLADILGEDTGPILQAWAEAAPDHPAPWDQLARYHGDRDQLEPAVAAARKAEALRPNLPHAALALARADFATDPAAALARLNAVPLNLEMLEGARRIHTWRAAALDRLDRPAEAAAQLREGVCRLLPYETMLPDLFDAPADGGTRQANGTLLWALPGVRVEPLVNGHLARVLDGRTRASAEDLVHGGPEAVAWANFIDGRVLSGYAGTRVAALVADPRDAFLAWMLRGSTQSFAFVPDAKLSAQWQATALQYLLDAEAASPGRVTWIRQDGEAAAEAARLSALLEVEVPADALAPPATGLPPAFAPGRWRAYREAFAEEFAILAPVAVALGYPAE